MKRMVMWATYIVTVCTLIVGALEWALRSSYFSPSYEQFGLKIILDEDVLYKIKPKSNADINNYGFRGADFSESRNGKKRILVLGDSFMMGLNVKADQTLSAALERRLGKNYEVYNMGILGYGPDQSLAQFQTIGKDFKPDMVILGLFGANDFGDIIKNELFIIDAHGELQRNPANAVKQVLPVSRIQYFLEWRKDPNSENHAAMPENFPHMQDWSCRHRIYRQRLHKKLLQEEA